MKIFKKTWMQTALALGAWSLLLAAALAPAGAAEKQAAADNAASQPGATVTGQVRVLAGQQAAFDLTDCSGMLMATPPQPPADVIKQGGEAVQKWFQEWQKTPEGEAQMKLRRFRKEVPIGPDGHFKATDVPAGKFTLHIAAFNTEEVAGEQGQPKQKVKTELRGQTTSNFEVTSQTITAGKPIDLGLITLTLPRVPQVGDPAPDFKVQTLDGKTVSLKDYRGKVVLLDFWATWCGPCRAELPNIKAAYEKYGKNPNFALISLSLDKEIAAPRDYVKQNAMGWTQGFLGDWNEDKVTKEYGVNSIPAMFLINPQGKIVAKGLRGERVSQAVARALSYKPGTPVEEPGTKLNLNRQNGKRPAPRKARP